MSDTSNTSFPDSVVETASKHLQDILAQAVEYAATSGVTGRSA